MTKPTNLRILPRAEWPAGKGDQYRGTVIRFDGDDGDDYRLFARSKALHGHQPLVDDPSGSWVWVDDPNGREVKRVGGEWVKHPDGSYVKGRYALRRRRTWTQIGGYEQGTGRSRTLANRPMDVVASDLPGSGPWQLMIDDRRDPDGASHSNMVEWGLGAEAGIPVTEQDQGLEAQKRETAPLEPPAALVADVRGYAAEHHKGALHVERWVRTLTAFGLGDHGRPMTAAEARGYANRGWGRWRPVADYLERM